MSSHDEHDGDEGAGGPRRSSGGAGEAPGGERPVPPPDDVHGSADATLGGYFRTHDRPPAFEGIDGHPYTVSIETEKLPDLTAPWAGFLVFPRWATTGVGIVGHVETPLLWQGRSREDVVRQAGETSLLRVKGLLDDAIRRAEGGGRSGPRE